MTVCVTRELTVIPFNLLQPVLSGPYDSVCDQRTNGDTV